MFLSIHILPLLAFYSYSDFSSHMSYFLLYVLKMLHSNSSPFLNIHHHSCSNTVKLRRGSSPPWAPTPFNSSVGTHK